MKRFLAVITLCLLLVGVCIPFTVAAAPAAQLLYDEANVLTDEQKANLEQQLSQASAKYGTDIAAAVVNGTDGQDITTFSDYFILNHNLGQNEGQDAILFVIDVVGREWHFSTHGETIYAFADRDIENLGQSVLPYLSNGDWAGAINEYCNSASGYIDYKKVNGVAVSEDPQNQQEEQKKSPAMPGLIGVIAGVLGSFGITAGMKGQLKTVKEKTNAADYFDPRNLRLRRHSDTFLYTNITRVPINTENKGGGGGFTTHTTGGSTFGGGGGKF